MSAIRSCEVAWQGRERITCRCAEGSRGTMRNRPYPVLKCSTFIFNVLCVGPGAFARTASRAKTPHAAHGRARQAARGAATRGAGPIHTSAVQRASAAVNSEYGQTMCGDARGRASGVKPYVCHEPRTASHLNSHMGGRFFEHAAAMGPMPHHHRVLLTLDS